MALARVLAARLSLPQASLTEHCFRHIPAGTRLVAGQAGAGEYKRGSQDIHDDSADEHNSSDTNDFVKNAASAPFHEAIRSAKIMTGQQKGFSKDDMAPAGNITQARHTNHDKEALYEDTLKKAKSKWQDHTVVESYKHAYDAPEAATATTVRQQFIPHARPQTAKANASQEAARQQQLYSDHAFAFDNVFSETSTTDEIYATCVAGIVEAAFAGINGAILTYGQTGSGKTYTLLGYGDVPGIVGLAVARICSFAQKSPDEVHLRISMLEIYKERIRDLLPEPNSKQSSLKVQDDPLAGVVVKGLTQHRVDDLRTIMQHLHQGNRRRQTASHNMNETSSRSHAIFQVDVEYVSVVRWVGVDDWDGIK
ncbi:hypothetical protein WJX84_010507 [Apatococcus fuscideae]|uniref:Kinesin motor domain-containing protein n=1 Tax=Apatococcus fuscideae TaxID=2026836 RepID=A0AAW1SPE6_9CHLO